MGTFDELVSSGKEFAMLLSALQEGKDADSNSVTVSIVFRMYLYCLKNV